MVHLDHGFDHGLDHDVVLLQAVSAEAAGFLPLGSTARLRATQTR